MGGVDGLAAAMLVAAVVVTPIAGWAAAPVLDDPVALAAGIGVGISSSVIPYVCDQLAMARLARQTYALLVALLPATATVIGLVVLAQLPTVTELGGLALVVAAVALHREPAPSVPSRAVTVLGRAALNRALLARNLLLERAAMPVLAAVEHLVGLQAQEPDEPYTGLWSRLQAFDPASLSELLETRQAVRTLLMRRTLHLVSARDCLALRPLHQAVLEKRMHATLGPRLPGVDYAELARLGRRASRSAR